jgi:hypothetical protein
MKTICRIDDQQLIETKEYSAAPQKPGNPEAQRQRELFS